MKVAGDSLESPDQLSCFVILPQGGMEVIKYWLEEKMKSIIYLICISILIGCVGIQGAWAEASPEVPEWMTAFEEDYDEFGMSVAVENALEDDVTPHEILTFIISHAEKFRIKRGLKALYCAGVDRDTVREAANKLGITVEDLSLSLEEAIAECGSKITLDDRDLMDEPASSPALGASTTNQSVEKNPSALISNPASSAQPSSPATP